MATTQSITYNRAPSKELQALLQPKRLLEPLLALNKRKHKDIELDVHFRPDDKIHVYCGLTKLLTVQRLKNGNVKAGAHLTYSEQPCAQALLRRWRANESGFGTALNTYLNGVEVESKYIQGEGAVQLRWSRVRDPWLPFDREAVLDYENMAYRDQSRKFSEVEYVRAELKNMAAAYGWETPSLKVGSKLDQLAVDSDGRLALIECKDASKGAAKMYYAPLQLLQYVWEWHTVLEGVRGQLQELIDVRMELRLPLELPPRSATRLTGGIRAAVCFGPDKRSAEVKSRARIVLDVVNRNLPPSVPVIETWAMDAGSSPRRLAF